MSNQRYQIALLSMLFVLAAATASQGGTARLVALGGDGSYFSDSSNVRHWYSTLVDYPNQVELEWGDVINDGDGHLNSQGIIGHGGSIHTRLKDNGSWGTAAFYFQDQLANAPTDGAFTGLWSRELGPIQIGLGGRFTTHGRSMVGTAVGDRVDSQYFHQYGFGISGEPWSGFRLEAAGEIVNTLASNSGALFNLTPTSNWETYNLRLRGFININPEVTLVPLVDYSCVVQGVYDDGVGGPVDRDANTGRFGLGANIQVRKNQLLLVSCEYRTGSEELRLRVDDSGSAAWDNRDRDYYQIRCRSGLESSIFTWLTVRASVSYIRVHDDQYSYDNGLDIREEHYVLEGVTTPLALGVGFRYGSMTADFTYNDTAPLDVDLASGFMFRDDNEGYSALTLGWEF